MFKKPTITRTTDSYVCQECAEDDGLWFIVVLVFLVFFALPLLYFLTNDTLTAKMSEVTLIVVSFGSLLTALQMVSVLSRTSVDLENHSNQRG